MSIVEKLTARYPQWPKFLANTAASKVIQLIKNKAIDPVFGHDRTVQRIQSWPTPIKKMAEWVMYTLSGAVRTMPDQKHPIAIILQEALAETFTQVGIKIDEVSVAERTKIVVSTLPIIRAQIIGAVEQDQPLREKIDTILGTVHDWNEILDEAENSVSRVREKTQAHRVARKARGWRRFLWWK